MTHLHPAALALENSHFLNQHFSFYAFLVSQLGNVHFFSFDDLFLLPLIKMNSKAVVVSFDIIYELLEIIMRIK